MSNAPVKQLQLRLRPRRWRPSLGYTRALEIRVMTIQAVNRRLEAKVAELKARVREFEEER